MDDFYDIRNHKNFVAKKIRKKGVDPRDKNKEELSAEIRRKTLVFKNQGGVVERLTSNENTNYNPVGLHPPSLLGSGLSQFARYTVKNI